MAERRFPPPWTVEELDAWFVVRDADGQAGCTDGDLTLLLGHA